MYIVIGLFVLIALYFFYSKFKDVAYTAKDKILVKKDEALLVEEKALKAKVEELKKIQKEATNLTPEEIENFWGKK